MTIDEGRIKYEIDFTPGRAPDIDAARELERCRRPLYEAGLIGRYKELGVGFGNLSRRCGPAGQFLISGTQTGHLARTDERHYSLVTACDVAANKVRCEGPVRASSEAMTHAAIYELSRDIEAVVHVHSRELWDRHLNRLPTTDPDVAYGTPEMARDFARLYAETDFPTAGIAVMAGHEDGLIGIGASLDAATARILRLVRLREPAPDRTETCDTP